MGERLGAALQIAVSQASPLPPGGNCFPVTGHPGAPPEPGPPVPPGSAGTPRQASPRCPQAASIHSAPTPDPLLTPGDRPRRPAARGSPPPARCTPRGPVTPTRCGAGEGAHLPPALGAAARPCIRPCPWPPARGEVPAWPASPPQGPASPAGPHGRQRIMREREKLPKSPSRSPLHSKKAPGPRPPGPPRLGSWCPGSPEKVP